jgi:dTDP-4-dehydrorhamnose 3,5-epimerase
MQIEKTPIEGLFVIKLDAREDSRGFLIENFRMSELQKAMNTKPFVQGVHTRTMKGVLRGLHAEPWDKLIYVNQGKSVSVLADIRPESKTFGTFKMFELGENSRIALYAPNGLAHGCCVLSETADYTYLFTDEYKGQPKRAVAWDDKDLNIPWPVKQPSLSDADTKNPTLRQLFPEKFR